MPTPTIEIDDHGLQKRMATFPQMLNKEMGDGMNRSLIILNENVPPYAPKRPNQKYVRTERLGRSLGSGFSGGRLAFPDIFEVRKIGQGVEGRFGTRLFYAEKVIGEGTQGDLFVGRWWTIKKVADNSREKIIALWNGIMNRLAAFLDGKGM